MRFSWRHRTLSFYAVVGAILFGITLVGLNVYQLWNLPWYFARYKVYPPYDGVQKVVWLCARQIYHLNHVMAIFQVAGYSVIHSTVPPPHWNVMWAFDFPFKKEYMPVLTQAKFYQKINHVPGTGFFTLKVELATSKLSWIPLAFSMPSEKEKLIEEAKAHPEKLWVQKSNDHRGIKIVDLSGLELNAEDTFVQQFVRNPMLIDGKKFDIGVYTVITSVNPLRVYIYENEFLVRFCLDNYEPFDVGNINKYVVGEDYLSPFKMPSLQLLNTHGHLNRKGSLFAYLENKGRNTSKLWLDVKVAIAELFVSKEKDIFAMYQKFPSRSNFFELVRVDFIMDEEMNVWLMEVNMSPNLSSYGHQENQVMYQQVLLNTLSLVGIAAYVQDPYRYGVSDVLANDGDFHVAGAECLKAACLSSCKDKCSLCNHCLSSEIKKDIRNAYMEHIHKGNFRRVLPTTEKMRERFTTKSYTDNMLENNLIMSRWFQAKCKSDRSWCQ